MSFEQFMKQNKVVKPNVKFAPTASLVDENGKPLEFEIKHITTKESEKIRVNSSIDVPISGKPNMFRTKLQTDKYLARLIASCVVVPDLQDAALQDSYGVATPEDLIVAMIDNPIEYDKLANFVQDLNDIKGIDEKVNEAKN